MNQPLAIAVDLHARVAQPNRKPHDRLGLRAQEIDAPPAGARRVEQTLHQVDAGHALRDIDAELARPPDDRLPVGGDDVGGLEVGPVGGVVVGGDEVRGVDPDVHARRAALDTCRDGPDRVVHVEQVERQAQEADAAARVRQRSRRIGARAPERASRLDHDAKVREARDQRGEVPPVTVGRRAGG